jgi:hypothetical protein
MVYAIKMFEGKWRVHIDEETFEFESIDELLENVKNLTFIKNKYGRINNAKRK